MTWRRSSPAWCGSTAATSSSVGIGGDRPAHRATHAPAGAEHPDLQIAMAATLAPGERLERRAFRRRGARRRRRRRGPSNTRCSTRRDVVGGDRPDAARRARRPEMTSSRTADARAEAGHAASRCPRARAASSPRGSRAATASSSSVMPSATQAGRRTSSMTLEQLAEPVRGGAGVDHERRRRRRRTTATSTPSRPGPAPRGSPGTAGSTCPPPSTWLATDEGVAVVVVAGEAPPADGDVGLLGGAGR